MSDYETIIYEVDSDGVATITLNRPERRNALSHDLMHELEDVVLVSTWTVESI